MSLVIINNNILSFTKVYSPSFKSKSKYFVNIDLSLSHNIIKDFVIMMTNQSDQCVSKLIIE